MKKIFLLIVFIATIQSIEAKFYFVSSQLSGSQEVPANNSAGTGQIFGVLDDVTGQFSYTIVYNALSSAVNISLIHEGAEGRTGPGIFTITPTINPITGIIVLSSQNVIDLLENKLYLSIKTVNFPTGEVRGQLGGVEIFEEATKMDFFNLKKHAFTDKDFTGGLQQSPYVRKGPNPNNPFVYVASAATGIYNDGNAMSTLGTNDQILIEIKSPNVRMFAADCFVSDFTGQAVGGDVFVAAFTSQGRFVQMVANETNRFIGLKTFSENEYIIQVLITKASTGNYVTLDNLVLAESYDHNLALEFDGINDNVFLPNSIGDFNFNDEFTVEFWMQAGEQLHNEPYSDIVDKFIANQPYPFLIQLGNTTNPGAIKISRKDGSNTTSFTFTEQNMKDGLWHHIAFVRGSAEFKIYIDGYFRGGISDLSNSSTQNNSSIFLGGGAQTYNFFKGKIDEFRVWAKAKTGSEILNEMYCKNPQNTNLQAFLSFDQGEPEGNNTNIGMVKNSANEALAGTMSSFAKSGSTSNFVDGQIRYIDASITVENQDGKKWETAYPNLPALLSEYTSTCNDLAEVWVANGVYRPGSSTSDRGNAFEIPAGMKLLGGFAGDESSILDRDPSKIHTDNLSVLSGDSNNDDSPMNFGINKADNSYTVVKLLNDSNVLIDGFEISGGYYDVSGNSGFGAGGITAFSSSPTFKNLRIVDNFGPTGGVLTNNADALYENCTLSGNKSTFKISALWIRTDNAIHVSKFYNCMFSGNHASGSSFPSTIYNRADGFSAVSNPEFYNCNIVNNVGLGFDEDGSTTNPEFSNSVIYGNSVSGIRHASNNGSPTLKYSLVQDLNPAANGNLDGITVNPNFENPLAHNSAPTVLGDYRLKWCSKLIDAGNIYPLPVKDLGSNPRFFGPNPDIGAFEYLGNAPTNDPTIDFGTNTLDVPYGVGMSSTHIISANKIWAPGGTIIFRAPNSITLNPGFEAKGLGQFFEAKILPNVGCVNN
jgi:hypothetical protein